MAALLTDADDNTPGNAVEFTDHTTLFPGGVFAGAIATIEARVPNEDWRAIWVFRAPQDAPINVNINGTYELRAVPFNAAPTTSITIDAT